MLNTRNILLAAAAATLLWFGIPNFLAAVWMATGEPIYRDLGAGKQLTSAEIETLIESREQAVMLTNNPKAMTDLGAAYIAIEASPENIEKALTSLRSGIELAPLNAFAWQRLAGLAAFAPGNEAEALNAWRTARRLAEYDTFLFYDRIRVGTLVYRTMEPEDRDALLQDIERAYRENRGALRAYARTSNLLEWLKFLLRDEEKTKFLTP